MREKKPGYIEIIETIGASSCITSLAIEMARNQQDLVTHVKRGLQRSLTEEFFNYKEKLPHHIRDKVSLIDIEMQVIDWDREWYMYSEHNIRPHEIEYRMTAKAAIIHWL